MFRISLGAKGLRDSMSNKSQFIIGVVLSFFSLVATAQAQMTYADGPNGMSTYTPDGLGGYYGGR